LKAKARIWPLLSYTRQNLALTVLCVPYSRERLAALANAAPHPASVCERECVSVCERENVRESVCERVRARARDSERVSEM